MKTLTHYLGNTQCDRKVVVHATAILTAVEHLATAQIIGVARWSHIATPLVQLIHSRCTSCVRLCNKLSTYIRCDDGIHIDRIT